MSADSILRAGVSQQRDELQSEAKHAQKDHPPVRPCIRGPATSFSAALQTAVAAHVGRGLHARDKVLRQPTAGAKSDMGCCGCLYVRGEVLS
jgi:hypothetical protein